eukprot:SAG11_NODE_11993_length_727_cov_1.044586_1_plen_143_part_01
MRALVLVSLCVHANAEHEFISCLGLIFCLGAGGEDGEIRLWDIKTREMVSHLKEHIGPVTGIALCSDHVHALSCSRDRSIFVWDLRQEKHVASNTQRMGGINAVRSTPMIFPVLPACRPTAWHPPIDMPTDASHWPASHWTGR